MKFDLFKKQTPVVPVRVMHLDLKGFPPTFDRLLELLDIFAAARYNALLMEWENMFPWTIDERFRCKTAYTAEQIKAFAEKAESLDMEIIPLVQCLGHMQTPLGVADYAHLREVPYNASDINALADGAHELVQGMIEDALKLTPNVRRFHLGGDEAHLMGKNPQTAAYIEKHSKADLYLHFVEPLMDYLNGRGIRPLLWHDMMREWDDDALRRLGEKTDIVVWGYDGEPDTSRQLHNVKHIHDFARNGIKLWGAAAYKGAEGSDANLPDPEKRLRNNLGWTHVAQQEGLEGIFVTAWSRWGTNDVQCEPIDAALDVALLCGVVLHDGEAPQRGIDACREALIAAGDDHLAVCREPTARMDALLKPAWKKLEKTKHQLTLYRLDSSHQGGELVTYFRYQSLLMRQIEEAGEKFRKAFAGLMDPIWIEEHLVCRIETLRIEVDAVGAIIKKIDPVGYKAEIGK